MRSTVRVRVSATSANLGPGFDALGLAVGMDDELAVTCSERPGARVQVRGEGAGRVGTGERHLVVRAIRHALRASGVVQSVGLDLLCRNVIPHGRGLGSSAAAIVAGVLAGDRIAQVGGAAPLAPQALLALATELEGHPDNAAAALLGGVTVAWTDGGRPQAVRVPAHPSLRLAVLVPAHQLATRQARAVLPEQVPHADAAAGAGRAALLVHAVGNDPGLLLPATEDWLHQRQRASAMPATLEMVDALRQQGIAAVVSGAGPTVLVLGTAETMDRDRARLTATGPTWRVLFPELRADPPVVAWESDEG